MLLSEDYFVVALWRSPKDRRQYVKIGTVESAKKSVKCGVPQGSILGPQLFIIYLNGVTPQKSKERRTILYADETVVFNKSSTDVGVGIIHDDTLAAVANWFP